MDRCGRLQEAFGLLLVSWLAVGPVLAQVRHPLPILWMMPFSSGSGNLTAGVDPAVRLALQDLEKQPPPLGSYEIQLQLLDSQCDPGNALRALFDAMWAGPRPLLVLGGACPPVTALIGRSLPALGLVQVSFAASAPSLSNRRWFGNLFSTVPSDRALNQAAVKLLQRHRWSRVGVIAQEGPQLSEMKKDLIRQLQKAEIHLAATESFSADACSSLRKLKDQDVRIIIGLIEEESASEVFCCAYRLNLFGARYQWVVAGGRTAGWRLGWRPSGCTASSLLTAADGSFRLQLRLLSSTNTPGVSGRTPQEYQDSYLRQLTQHGSEVSSLHAFAYDAVWVAARALGQVMETVKHREKYSAQRNGVSEEEVVEMLLEAVRSSQFEGVTGPVSFRNGERMSSIELIQFQGSSGVLVGEFNTSNLQLRLMNHLLKFKGSGPAKDRTLVRLQHRQVSLLLYSILSAAAAVTISIILTVLCFIIIFHKRWLLSSGSASRDELLLLGMLLSCASVPLSGLDEASLSDRMFDIMCSAHLWTLSVGHAVGFIELFAKTWRLYSLCTFQQKQTRRQHTGCFLLWIFLLDVLLLTFWQILDPLKWVKLQHSPEGDPADQDVIIRAHSERCSSTNMETWLTAVYGYKAPQLGLGCFLAWNVRTAEASGKLLSLSMFGVAVFSLSGVLGSQLASHNPPAQFCLSSIFILSCNVFLLSSLFAPQMVRVLRSSSELQDEAPHQEDEDEPSRLNLQLKSQSSQLDLQIETITMQLSEMSEQHVAGGKHGTLGFSGTAGVSSLTHEAQVCSHRDSEGKASSPDNINSPEHVRRRLSFQLPILHHSYLPAIGGISSSSSSLFSRPHSPSSQLPIHQMEGSCSVASVDTA
ncbi:gamma-aminobutyric acid type B receptor subunit 2-like [Leuresthes tenuis]|uniref:gamma-aminobutyric acid type B receptor subunit 2-like n=1 Tax=Leuresthes tenuis TaxID=355514 RepID=UPI003B50E634